MSAAKKLWTVVASLVLFLSIVTANPPERPPAGSKLPLEDIEPDVQETVRLILKASTLDPGGNDLNRILMQFSESIRPQVIWSSDETSLAKGLQKLGTKLKSLRTNPGHNQTILIIEVEEQLKADQVVRVAKVCKNASVGEIRLTSRSKEQADRIRAALKRARIEVVLVEAPPMDPLIVTDIDPAALDLDINYHVERKADVRARA